ncbi:MAG: 3-dehydroquinate synthase [Parvularculaceae bacterium]
MTAEIVEVGLADRRYAIEIGEGLLERAGAIMAPHMKRKFCVVVTDSNIDAAQGGRLYAGMNAEGIAFEKIVLPPGEATKDFAHLEELVERLISLEIERSDVVVAFGGGVVGDIAGFASAVAKRGCRTIQVPTTLLAQVDSSVGGKTAINSAHGKNLIGLFHQPCLVIADVGALSTLPARELKAGYAEVVKYAALGDEPFLAWLENRMNDVLGADANARRIAVKRCCESKAQIVEADEREQGVRALLNLGHTFGHALEAATGFSDALVHGEAVAVGMALAFDYSVTIDLCPKDDAMRLKAHIKSAGLPASLEDLGRPFEAEALLAHMMHDKKVEAGALTLILAKRIGEAFIAKDVDPNSVLAFLKSCGAK